MRSDKWDDQKSPSGGLFSKVYVVKVPMMFTICGLCTVAGVLFGFNIWG